MAVTSKCDVTGIRLLDAKTGKIKFALESGGQMADWTADGKYLAVKTSRSIAVYHGKTGETLWSKEMVSGNKPNAGSINFSLYYSDDGKYLVATYNKDESERSWGTSLLL